MARNVSDPGKQSRFEDILNELQSIVDKLETGELSLEESLSEYERGMKLVKLGNRKLDEAEKKLEILAREMEEEKE